MPESAAGVTDWLAGEHPYLVLLGDVRETLRAIPDATVRCCVTSPPYFGLRDYGLPASSWGGQSDCTHDWSESIRSPWANLIAGPNGRRLNGVASRHRPEESGQYCQVCGAWRGCLGLEPSVDLFVQHLVEIFREVRRVLTPDGTLWCNLGDSFNGSGGAGGDYSPGGLKAGQPKYPGRKLSGLKPKDLIGVPWRVALALQADGWWLRSDIVWSKTAPMPESVKDRPTRSHEYIFLLAKSESYYYDADAVAEPLKHPAKANGSFVFGGQKYRHSRLYSGKPYRLPANGKRNRRSVWQINNRASGVKHFATFPPELPRLCLLAGSAPGDVILDPFAGSGTTLAVATELGRRALGCELNPAYVDLIHDRLATAQTRILAS